MYDKLHTQFKSTLDTIPHMKTSYPEVEIRFGYILGNSFQSSLPKHIFDNLLVMFQSSKTWSHTEVSSNKDYFRGNLRITPNKEKSKPPICIQKLKLGSCDFKNNDNEVDLRLSISTETPVQLPDDIEPDNIDKSEFDTIRSKVRYSFYYKGIWRYDFTIVNSDVFEIEIELVDPKTKVKIYQTQYLSDSLVLKVKDIIKQINSIK